MSAEIIVLPMVRVERCEGNGAREALIEIGKSCPFHVSKDVAINWADDVLMELWARGFKVVPLNSTDEV
jgi:hypothetical protein